MELDEALLKECQQETPNLQKIQTLLGQGASYKVADKDGRTAFQWAGRLHDINLISVFLEHGADPNTPSLDFYKGAPSVVWMDRLRWVSNDIVRLYLSHGADVKAKPPYAESGLIWYLLFRDEADPEIIKIFLDRGIDINATDTQGETALHWLVQSWKNLPAIECIVGRGANVNAKSLNGSTPLHVAVAKTSADPQYCRYLLEHGADPNIPCPSPFRSGEITTVLHVAVTKEILHDKVVILLEGGADRNAKNAEGKTPYEVALANGFLKIAELFNINAKQDMDTRPDNLEIEKIKQAIIGRLKAGKTWGWGNKENNGELYFDSQRGIYVEETFDSMVYDSSSPESVCEINTDAAVLDRLFGSHKGGYYDVKSEVQIYKDILFRIDPFFKMEPE